MPLTEDEELALIANTAPYISPEAKLEYQSRRSSARSVVFVYEKDQKMAFYPSKILGAGGTCLVREFISIDARSLAVLSPNARQEPETSSSRETEITNMRRAVKMYNAMYGAGFAHFFDTPPTYRVMMRKFNGQTLEQLLGRPIPCESLLVGLVHASAEATLLVHRHRIIHGDIKEDNLMVGPHPTQDKVVAFPIDLEGAIWEGDSVTPTPLRLIHVAPERISKKNPLDFQLTAAPSLDIFSLASLIQRMYADYCKIYLSLTIFHAYTSFFSWRRTHPSGVG